MMMQRTEPFGPFLAGDIARAWAHVHAPTAIAQVADIVRSRAELFDEPCAATVARAQALGVEGIVREARAKCAGGERTNPLKMYVDHWDGACGCPAHELAMMVEGLVTCGFCGCKEAHSRHREHGFPCDSNVMQPIMQAEHERDKARWQPGTQVHDGRYIVTRSSYTIDAHPPAWFRWSDNLGISSYHGSSGSHFWEAGDPRDQPAKYAHWYIEETRVEFVTFDLFGGAARDETKIEAFAAEARARSASRRADHGLVESPPTSTPMQKKMPTRAAFLLMSSMTAHSMTTTTIKRLARFRRA
jgi:hypothetical protein